MSTETMALTAINEEEIQREIAPVVAMAGSLVVRNQDDRDAAMDFVKSIKAAQLKVSTFFDPIVDAAHKAWKRTTEGRAKLLDPLKSAEATVKSKVVSYDAEIERLRLEQQRRLQAEADEKARRERERLEREAMRLKTPELREQRLAEAAQVIAPTVEIAAPEKPTGEATRRVWKAKLVDKVALIKAAADGNELAASLLAFDQSAANRTAAATKGVVRISGVEMYQERQLAVGGRS